MRLLAAPGPPFSRETENTLNFLTGRELAVSLAARGGVHAIMLEGERGCGKKTLARRMAAAMLCKSFDSASNRACGVCGSCLKILDGTHPDVTFLGDGAKTITVDEIRALRAAAGVRPNEADVRLFVICDGQNMTVQAQNALLKVLEEPPVAVRFIITCDNASRMLETIVSRAVSVRIGGLPVDECVRALRGRFPDVPEERLREISEIFEGNAGRCIEALDTQPDSKTAELFGLSERAFAAAGSPSGWKLLEVLSRFEKDKEGFLRFLELLRLQCRCARLPAGASPEENLRRIAMTRAIDRAASDVARNVYYPLALAAFSAALRGE